MISVRKAIGSLWRLLPIGLLVCLLSVKSFAADGQGTPPYDAALVDSLVENAIRSGNPGRGAVLYAAPTSACLSCHRVGEHGGRVGPDLSDVGAKQKVRHIVESLIWPQRTVNEEYQSIAVLTVDGRVFRGYPVKEDAQVLVMRDSANGKSIEIAQEEIEDVQNVGSLMPDGLLSTLTDQDKYDLISFLADLGKHKTLSHAAIDSLLAHSHGHHPQSFEMSREPLEPEHWPSWQAEVNRDRIYDFYRKQARHFRNAEPPAHLLQEFPGLDGGKYGHWGNQSEPTWADGRWNDSDLGDVLCGVFRGPGVQVARGICVRVDEDHSVCFDPDTLTYPRVWSGGFVKFSTVRHGFMQGLNQDGPTLEANFRPDILPEGRRQYLGFYRYKNRVIFSYKIDGTEFLDAPQMIDGALRRVVEPRSQHPDRDHLSGGSTRWPQEIRVRGELGRTKPYAIDKIPLPKDNPWKALIYGSALDFFSDGSAAIATMQGDIWIVNGLDESLQDVRWRRFASGLFQPLGMIIQDDQIYVLGRDQMTRLHDLNGNDEADFYESFSRVLETSTSGHDFTCGLWRDSAGRFYTASGKQGVMRVSSDGQSAERIAYGLRNSDGLGLTPDGLVTIPSSEGDWTPASMIAAVRPDGRPLNRLQGKTPDFRGESFFGRPGTDLAQPPDLPMLFLPRGLDNSSGGQVYINSERWGPTRGQMVHLSFGAGRAFLLLRDESKGWIQGAVVPLAGEFESGAHRGRFNPKDGQLYVTGMAGWGTYTTEDGCFQRVRCTDAETQLPTGFHIHENGIRVDFAKPIDASTASVASNHFAQAWNYRYSGAYGSAEYSSRRLGLRGHDVLPVESATVLADGRSLFLEIRELQPVNQLHLLVKTDTTDEFDLFMTVHHMDEPFRAFAEYRQRDKVILPHPILADLSRPIIKKRNPHNKAIQDAEPITISAAKNLMYDKSEIRVRAGQPVRLTMKNPDAVPHNWALLQPGTLKKVGELCNRMIANPEAAALQYIPQSPDVLAYTDVVEPYASHTIYFLAPDQPGRYPYLCTFPGHWMVMNGVFVVE